VLEAVISFCKLVNKDRFPNWKISH